jgi:hypothetical protein
MMFCGDGRIGKLFEEQGGVIVGMYWYATINQHMTIISKWSKQASI